MVLDRGRPDVGNQDAIVCLRVDLAGAITAFSGAFQATRPATRSSNMKEQRASFRYYRDGRQNFMASCLSGDHPRCSPCKSKRCWQSCIAIDKVCGK
jgi:hypothetical protein